MKSKLSIILVLFIIITIFTSCTEKVTGEEETINNEPKSTEQEATPEETANPYEELDEDIIFAIEHGIADESLIIQLDETANQRVVSTLIKKC